MTERDWTAFVNDLRDPDRTAERIKQLNDDPALAAELRTKIKDDPTFAGDFHAAAAIGKRTLEAIQTARILNDPGLRESLEQMRTGQSKEV